MIKQGDTWARRNQAFVGGAIKEVPLRNYRGADNWLTEGNTRKVASIYAQDQWAVIKPLTVTVGGRYDDYFENGHSFNPRLAAVYNFLDDHIFKVQFSKAFRPPTFLEMYIRNNIVAEGNASIKPETIESVEVGYIYNHANTNFRLTTFYSQLNDLIANDDTTGKYENLESIISRGAEVEVSQKIFGRVTLAANGTYLKVKNKTNDEALPDIANIYGNATATYQISGQMSVAASDQYVGSRQRTAGDPRSSLAAYHVLNASFSKGQMLSKNVTLNIGVKNILDQSVHHPSPMVTVPGGAQVPSYIDDYPRPGREIWLNVDYKY